MAEPIPVDRQKQLFDATKEAEKVLHYLSSMSPSQLTLQLLPNLFEHAIVEMKKKLEIGMVCVCVYIFVFVFTYLYLCFPMCTYVFVPTYLYLCLNINIYVYIFVFGLHV